jgi:hypothetical protein
MSGGEHDSPQGTSLRRIAMFRNVAFAAINVAVLVFLTAALARAADYGTADEARAMLDKAVAAVTEDKAKALDMFNRGEGGFKDRRRHCFTDQPWRTNVVDCLICRGGLGIIIREGA